MGVCCCCFKIIFIVAIIWFGPISALTSYNWMTNCLETELTHKELTVELQKDVPISRSRLRLWWELIHLNRCLFHVPFDPNVVPLVVIEVSGGLHRDFERPIPHIKWKSHYCWSWKYTWRLFKLVPVVDSWVFDILRNSTIA